MGFATIQQEALCSTNQENKKPRRAPFSRRRIVTIPPYNSCPETQNMDLPPRRPPAGIPVPLYTQQQQPLSGIEKPHNNDVLCGRGVTTNRHVGNENFRSLVNCNKVRSQYFVTFLSPVLHARRLPLCDGITNLCGWVSSMLLPHLCALC